MSNIKNKDVRMNERREYYTFDADSGVRIVYLHTNRRFRHPGKERWERKMRQFRSD